jgi:regulator of protease activity HflC (stomatin/prohibitin superfamily)
MFGVSPMAESTDPQRDPRQDQSFPSFIVCAIPASCRVSIHISQEFIMIFLLIPIVVLFLSGFRIAQEYQRGVVFRLGRFSSVKGPGLYWIIPLIDWQKRIDIRTTTVAVEQQETITKDSVTIMVNAVLWYKIVDPAKAIIAVASFNDAVYQVALTSLRNIIGQHVLDEVLKERDAINGALARIVNEATSAWGIQVEMVEMKDVEIPAAMQRAMAREAEAIREKRARLIKAEAEQEASMKLAEASEVIARNPLALELRRMQMVQEVGAENNTTTIVMLPSDMISLANSVTNYLNGQPRKAGRTKRRAGLLDRELGAVTALRRSQRRCLTEMLKQEIYDHPHTWCQPRAMRVEH